ncbi:hypothetical protein J3458_015299 [Metarhizium acridum]|uniref:uncharacterized protein n=1 Tax=Metarhizium acridum TaxID=92637 RepID=UPI001C6BAB6A|nr:hypothetical protein J3458_015299 [Metarhizium acridum]
MQCHQYADSRLGYCFNCTGMPVGSIARHHGPASVRAAALGHSSADDGYGICLLLFTSRNTASLPRTQDIISEYSLPIILSRMVALNDGAGSKCSPIKIYLVLRSGTAPPLYRDLQ